jgi:hypothetical protein
VTRPARRLAFLVPVLALGLTACSGATGTVTPVPSASVPTPAPVNAAPSTGAPVGQVEPSTDEDPTLPPTNQGNVGQVFPELSVSLADGVYALDLTDPAAKAWRIVVAGLDAQAQDRLEVEAEIGDVGPAVLVRAIVGGRTVDETELTAFLGDPTATAGGCHPTLQVCFAAQGISVDPENGSLKVILEHVETGRFRIQGASASWGDEPFVPGEWRTSEPLVTD